MVFQVEFEMQRNKSSLLLGLCSCIFVSGGRRKESQSFRREAATPAESQCSSPASTLSPEGQPKREWSFLADMPLLVPCLRLTGLHWLPPPAFVWVLQSVMFILFFFLRSPCCIYTKQSHSWADLVPGVRESKGFTGYPSSVVSSSIF